MEGFMPFISGWTIDNVVETGNLDMLKVVGIIYVFIIAIQVTTVYWFIYHAGKVESGKVR